jgi:hypothetical protein
LANKEFQVRHGLIVGNNVLVANVTSNTVGVLGTITANVIRVGGSTIPSGDVSNLVYTTANAAFDKANSAGGSPVDAYVLNDIDGTDPIYIGKVSSANVWLVQKYSTASGTMRYANLSNNATYITYTQAWTARANLSYSLFQDLTGV